MESVTSHTPTKDESRSGTWATPVVPAAISYPPELIDTYRAGATMITAEDYPALLEKHGKFMVVVARMEDGLSFFVTRLAMIKLGIIGRCTKIVAAPVVLKYLSAEESAVFTDRDEILVCCPPVPGGQAIMLADVVMSEECFMHAKLELFTSLDAAESLTSDRVAALTADIRGFLQMSRRSYESRIEEVDTPIGEWNIYVQGSGGVAPDKLATTIKGFASRSARVCPPIPPIDPVEIDALFKINEILRLNGHAIEADLIMRDALESPIGVYICHRPDVIDGTVQLPQPVVKESRSGFNAGHLNTLLKYLLSEELTHAAQRDTKPSKVTPANKFILTLDEVLALKVPHAPISKEHAFDRLNTFVGGYLKDLDLSKTLITGSAIAASLIITSVEVESFMCPYNQYMRIFPRKTSKYFDTNSNARLCLGDDDKTEAVPNTDTNIVSESESESESEGEGETKTETGPDTKVPGPCIPDYVEWSNSIEKSANDKGYRDYIASHYPPTRTVPEDLEKYKTLAMGIKGKKLSIKKMETLVIKAKPSQPDKPAESQIVLDIEFALKPEIKAEEAAITFKDMKVRLSVEGGADVDMAVDVDTMEEFDRIAHDHFRVIHAMYPEAKLRKVFLDSVRYNWSVTTDCPGAISTFRPVEIYRANFNHVVTHHVGMVSGAYTAIFGGAPQFVMTARMVTSMKDLATPNYYYFASRKTLPQHVIMKYWMRGFGLGSFPSGLRCAIGAAMYTDPVWSGNDPTQGVIQYPALNGRGMFSAYSIVSESELVLD